MADEKGDQLRFSLNPETTPILYTDNVQMTANEDGVVLDICQRLGPSNEIRVVSRIGMSKEHAKKFLQALGELLAQAEGKIQSGRVARS